MIAKQHLLGRLLKQTAGCVCHCRSGSLSEMPGALSTGSSSFSMVSGSSTPVQVQAPASAQGTAVCPALQPMRRTVVSIHTRAAKLVFKYGMEKKHVHSNVKKTQCNPLKFFSERGRGSADLMRTVFEGKTFSSKHHNRSTLSTSLSWPLGLDIHVCSCFVRACVCVHVLQVNSGVQCVLEQFVTLGICRTCALYSPKCRPHSLKASVSVCSSFRQQSAARPKFQPSGDRHQNS